MADVNPLEAPEPNPAELAMLADWRPNLAALASCMATPADEALIVRLGDRLWEQQGQVPPSACCSCIWQSSQPSAVSLLVKEHRCACVGFGLYHEDYEAPEPRAPVPFIFLLRLGNLPLALAPPGRTAVLLHSLCWACGWHAT